MHDSTAADDRGLTTLALDLQTRGVIQTTEGLPAPPLLLALAESTDRVEHQLQRRTDHAVHLDTEDSSSRLDARP